MNSKVLEELAKQLSNVSVEDKVADAVEKGAKVLSHEDFEKVKAGEEVDATQDEAPTLTKDERKAYYKENSALTKKYSTKGVWLQIENQVNQTCKADIARQLAKMEWNNRAWTAIKYVNPEGKTHAFELRCADGLKHEVRFSCSGGKMIVAFSSKPTYAINNKLKSIGLQLDKDGMYCGSATKAELFSICPKAFNEKKHVYEVY